MDDSKTPNRWVKSLDQAGLLDEIEDGWSLPDGVAEPGASISVEGYGGQTIPPLTETPEPARESQTVLLQQGAVDVAIVDDVPRTPVERHRSSKPDAPSEPRPSEPHIELSSARATQSGLPRPSRVPPAAAREAKRGDAERLERPAAKKRPAAERPKADSEPPRWELVRKSKSRISVAPEAQRRSRPDVLEPIVDEPPEERRPRRRTSRPPRASAAPVDRRTQMRERLELGDYSGALAAAEEISKSGDEDEEVKRIDAECRRVLIGMYESRIGSFARAPAVVVSPQELVWRSLDATAGFVLSRIDGTSTFEDIVDVSGLSRFETCRILNQLLQDGIIR
jgi:hypothetical protein